MLEELRLLLRRIENPDLNIRSLGETVGWAIGPATQGKTPKPIHTSYKSSWYSKTTAAAPAAVEKKARGVSPCSQELAHKQENTILYIPSLMQACTVQNGGECENPGEIYLHPKACDPA